MSYPVGWPDSGAGPTGTAGNYPRGTASSTATSGNGSGGGGGGGNASDDTSSNMRSLPPPPPPPAIEDSKPSKYSHNGNVPAPNGTTSRSNGDDCHARGQQQPPLDKYSTLSSSATSFPDDESLLKVTGSVISTHRPLTPSLLLAFRPRRVQTSFPI